MDYIIHFPLLTILITILSALIIPILRNRKSAFIVTLFSFSGVFFLSLIMIFYFNNSSIPYFTYQLGHVSAPWANELRSGIFESIMSATLSLVMLLSILGGYKNIQKDISSKKELYFYLILNLLLSSILALIYTNDIFTAYVFIEINAIAACAIVVAKNDKDTIKATIKYFVMSILGSGIFLFSISTLYSITGYLSMSYMKEAISLMDGSYLVPLTTSFVLMSVGLFVKSALFPFHTWLPDAHGSATSSASAILSAVVLKGYIILLIKVIYRLFGIEVIEAMGVFPIFLVLGLLGMILGSAMALIQKDLKKMIAYSSVAQIGYIYLGIGMGSTLGMATAGFHIIVHALTKSMLFISGGNLLEIGNTKKIEDLKGLGRVDKVSGIMFTLGGLSMIGIPILSGFISKFMFINAALDSKYMVIIVIALAISTLLNGMYYVPVIISLFGKKGENENLNLNFISSGVGKLSLICLGGLNIMLGIFFSPVFNSILEGIAQGLG